MTVKTTSDNEHHNFLILLGDALLLLEHGSSIEKGQNTFARSVVVMGVAAIEAAINSAIYSACENNEDYLRKTRKPSVLDKAKHFLSEQAPVASFDKGSTEAQKFQEIVDLRNAMIHSNAATFTVTFDYLPQSETSRLAEFVHQSSYLHKLDKSQQLVVKSRTLELSEAKSALQVSVAFFNYFNKCWGIDGVTAQAIYVDWFYGARTSVGAAYETQVLQLISTHNDWLNLELI